MADKKIVLAKLDMDVKGLIEAARTAAAEIALLTKELDTLGDAGEDFTEDFSGMQQMLSELTGRLDIQTAAIRELTTQNNALAQSQRAVAAATSQAAGSQDGFTGSLGSAAQMVQELEATSRNAREAMAGMNSALRENEALMASGSAATGSQAKTMDDYKKMVTDSFESINVFNGGFSGFISRAQEAGGVGPLLSKAFSDITTGIRGMGKAIMANPMGTLIALLVYGVQAVMNVLKSITPIMDRVAQGMAALGAVMSVVKNAFVGLFSGAESAGEAFGGLGEKMRDAARDAAELKKAQQELEESLKLQEVQSARNRSEINRLNTQAKDMSKTERERQKLLDDAMKLEEDDYNQRKKNGDEKYRQALEDLRLRGDLTKQEMADFKKISDEQINTNSNMTAEEAADLERRAKKFREFIEDRSGNAEELFKNLEDAQKAQIEMDNDYYKVVENNIAAKNKIIEEDAKKPNPVIQNLERQKAAAEAYGRDAYRIEEELYRKKMELYKKDTQEYIDAQNGLAALRVKYSQQREQDSRKLLSEKAQTLSLEYDLYVQAEEDKERTMDQEIAYAEQLFEKKIDIAEAEYNATDKIKNDSLRLKFEQIEAGKDLDKARLDAVIANAQKEYQAVVASQQEILKANEFLTEELVKKEKERLDNIANAQKDALTKKMAAEQASAIETNAALDKIEKENKTAKNALDVQLNEEETARKLIDIENRRAADQLTFEEDMDLKLANLKIRREQELEEANKTGADKKLINEKFDKQEEEIENAKLDHKLGLYKQAFSNFASILGQHNAASKAFSVAQATIDTYQAANKALSAYPPPFSYIAAGAAVASGLANVKKIVSTKTPKAEKGALFSIGGNRHSAGGTLFTGADGTRFEAEQGELIGVMNRNAARHFMAFNNAFPAGGAPAPNYFAGGGIVSREIAQQSINMDELASKIAEANRAMPAPVVAVQDIVDVGSKVAAVRESAQF
ncbi:hypothetical protein [uncultured Flavobacterium sp.]|uniref:hypothetical protein n=1 Tax=uncultured Flavobacterium sp. TaxID=165435 RepID=UPI0025D2E99B|nr:hypothetical protein [uncultured Flavobacterium sp.]